MTLNAAKYSEAIRCREEMVLIQMVYHMLKLLVRLSGATRIFSKRRGRAKAFCSSGAKKQATGYGIKARRFASICVHYNYAYNKSHFVKNIYAVTRNGVPRTKSIHFNNYPHQSKTLCIHLPSIYALICVFD